jgi:hypothetical protein
MEKEPSLEGKLTLLHRDRFDIAEGAVIVLGCTLWSKIPETAKVALQSKVNDFRKIQDWNIDAHNKAHRIDLNWLESEMEKLNDGSQGKRIVVVTRHITRVDRSDFAT